MSTSDRYICEACGRRFPQPGDCTDHPDEPLQDLANEDVRIMLDDFDSGRKRKRYGLLGIGALAITFPVVIFVPFRKLAIAAWLGSAAALTGVLFKFFPSRKVLPDLDKENPDWLKLS
jgi:hypothetical protein